MKRTAALMISLFLVLGVSACGVPEHPDGGSGGNSGIRTGSELGEHTIAVMVYNRGDDEVVSFRKYLTEYIGDAFHVEFLYSDSIREAKESREFIKTAMEYGAEGVMSFVTYDLPGEVALCEELGMYYIVASGTVSKEDFAAVEDSAAFLGAIGPGSFTEYKAGADMAEHFIKEHSDSTEFFILSGGGCLGNEMHLQRTTGILDTLKNAYDLTFDQTSEEIASSPEPVYIEAGGRKICVCPGYHTIDEYLELAKKEYAEHPYQNVLSVLPATHVLEEIEGADLAVVDCYSETNLRLFANGSLDYLVGKYSSIIGPAFAAMYNAVTGNAEMLRENGKAFHITQGFWVSDSAEDFDEKYVLASSVELNAYNYEDLQQVIVLFHPDATLDDLKALAEAYTFKDAIARRAQ